MIYEQFLCILPEILLLIFALSVQITSLFYPKYSRAILSISIQLLALIVVYICFFYKCSYGVIFEGSFLVTSNILTIKSIILFLLLITIISYSEFTKISGDNIKIEYVTLLLLSSLGVIISISAYNLLLLFCGIELQALSGYVLASSNIKKLKSVEAGLKYFVLGSFMSCIMLFGISFIFGFSSSIKYDEIYLCLNSSKSINIGLVFGITLVLISILFKFSAAPFHFWTPDVYEASPIISVIYFSSITKLGLLIVLINFINLLITSHIADIVMGFIKLSSIFSMLIGSLGAIQQRSIKRVIAYSTILNIGYILMAISLNSAIAQKFALNYIIIYIISTTALFICLISVLGKNIEEATFDDLNNIFKQKKVISLSILIIIFSIVGIPPLSGFFVKYYIFYSALAEGEITIIIFAIIANIISVYFYLKLLSNVYFLNTDKELPSMSQSKIFNIFILCSVLILLFAGFWVSFNIH
ncbi:NADH-quinone oxidoreductase subunit N [Rickettsia endosymbiont of Cardiosporidium cionae]|uniref:NADH-quinone oxidoreductase subunit N n=1 Tax=Rickettsia endosymbiont of Cardiosporidium cionae TaxID=2777155 RepID=UPI0018959F5D|nr:NADH-quinone oxidoreductase subunit N [Rickettsia endosymbiont of Cardiosporidium cionae]KAF8818908.1 NADH-quinone oxidoreductase subunit N [Rickettsia endosymbiont of Cardiosporidium cionae]